MKILGKTATLIMLILFFVSLCVLMYPSVSQYWNSHVQTKAVAEYNEMLAAMNKEDYTALFDRAREYNRRLFELEKPLSQFRVVEGYEQCLNPGGDGIMGYIDISKIGVELPIYHTTRDSVLAVGVGHLEGTSLPAGGESSHCGLSAHRGLPNAKLFTDLDRLEVGDTFVLNILGEVLTYQVDKISVVNPDQVEGLAIEEGRDFCTLITCTPYGINTQRLLVRGTRIETVQYKKIFVTTEAYIIDRLIVTPAVALPILFVLIMIVIFKPAKKKPKFGPNGELL